MIDKPQNEKSVNVTKQIVVLMTHIFAPAKKKMEQEEYMSSKKMSEKEPQVTVSFTVNEGGKAVNARIVGMRVDPKAEKLLQDAILKMPTWKPAKNSKGIIVKQEFNFQFGGGGC